LALESQGKLTVDVPTKFADPPNVFMIQTAPDSSYARNIEDLSKFTIEDLIKEVKAKIFERSSFGIRALGRIFSAMDENGNK